MGSDLSGWRPERRAVAMRSGNAAPPTGGKPKRLRRAVGLIGHAIRAIASDTALWTDDVWLVDSTPVECGRSRQTAKRSALAGWAAYGWCASHSRWLWGYGCTWWAPCTACRSCSP
jgi:hypothetical protein